MATEHTETSDRIVSESNGNSDLGSRAMSDALTGFVRGILPPQGVEAFGNQVQTTFTNVVTLYTNIVTQTLGGIIRAPVDGASPLLEGLTPLFKGLDSIVQQISNVFVPSENSSASCIQRKVRIPIGHKTTGSEETKTE